jgi:hypothetical protein
MAWFLSMHCSLCAELFCDAHIVVRDGVATCEGCQDERTRGEAECGVSPEQSRSLSELLLQDIRSTIGARLADDVARRAAELRMFASGFDDFRQRLVEDIQQQIHDEFIDTSWPACPGARNHPLWFADGQWRCHTHDVAIPLGELGK